MRTRFTEAFGIRHPVACAPMARITGGSLAAAVSGAGGLGIVGGGFARALGDDLHLKQEVAHLQGHKFGIGFITWALARNPQMLDEALSHSPSCVFLSFGDPRPFAERIRQSGTMLMCQVQSLRHVDEAIEAGAAAIVAQGTEAGGHGARRSTLPFVPEVADYLARNSPSTLLLAAGGIADGRGLAAALMLGADGVLVGTRFMVSEEALGRAAAADWAVRATGDETVRTRVTDALRGVPWPEEFSSRMFQNKLTKQWAHREAEIDTVFGSLAADYAQARSRQDFDVVTMAAGECVGLIHERRSAASILEMMVTQGELLLRHGATLDFTQSTAERSH